MSDLLSATKASQKDPEGVNKAVLQAVTASAADTTGALHSRYNSVTPFVTLPIQLIRYPLEYDYDYTLWHQKLRYGEKNAKMA